MAYQNEKSEKDEKEQEEKHWEEKDWRRDSLSGIIWALVLIWAGIVLLLVSLDFPAFDWLDWDRGWGAILIGIALLLGAEISIRLMMPSYAAPIRGRAILAIILAVLGISNFVDVELWPLILIGIGFSILFGAFTRGGGESR